ncbi:MAG: hypothetical protein AAFU58_03420 [Pseudomonadota bacterium]
MAKATNKTAPTRQSVDDFLDGIEHKARRADALVCLALMKR